MRSRAVAGLVCVLVCVLLALPTAAFTATPTSGNAPLVVQFTDTSTQFPTSWQWDFNDDGVTDASGPTAAWTFQTVGAHPVRIHAGVDQCVHLRVRRRKPANEPHDVVAKHGPAVLEVLINPFNLPAEGGQIVITAPIAARTAVETKFSDAMSSMWLCWRASSAEIAA